MTLTNVHHLPEPIVRSLAFDDYTKGEADISVTGLIAPPQIAHLERLHEHEIEEDVSERTWLALGRAIHILFERHTEAPLVSEKRLYMPCLGWTVSGQPDLQHDLTVDDYKSTSVWTAVYEPEGRVEWHRQLNLYRLLLEANGYEVKQARVIALYRDWNKRESLRGGKYPPIPWGVIDIPLWSRQEAEAYLNHRVLLHQRERGEGIYPGCTDEERWKNAKGYARCEGYCRVANWCEQFQGEKK